MTNQTIPPVVTASEPANGFSLRRNLLLVLLVSFVLVNGFALLYLHLENTVAHFNGFWVQAMEIRENLLHAPSSALQAIIHNLQIEGYNCSGVLPLLIFLLPFGTGRIAYTLSLINIHFLPVLLLSFLLWKRTAGDRVPRHAFLATSLVVGLALLQPHIWSSLLWGNTDTGGMIFILLLFLLYRRHPLEQQTFSHAVIQGVLFALIILLRRWYSIWVTAFCLSIAVDAAIAAFRSPMGLKSLARSALILVCSAAIAIVILLLIARPATIEMLQSNYSDAYAAHLREKSDLLGFIAAFRKLGSIYAWLFWLSVPYVLVVFRKERRFLILLIAQLILSYVIFHRIQDPDPHHFQMFFPTILLFMGLAFTHLLQFLPRALAAACTLLVIVFLTVNFAIVFFPQINHFAQGNAFFPDLRTYPARRNDLSEFFRLRQTLNTLLTAAGKKESVYTLSVGAILDAADLRYGHLISNEPPDILSQSIVGTSVLDKRDSFPAKLLTSKFIVVSVPIQHELQPNDELLLELPFHALLENTTIGHAFEKLPYDFPLAKGIHVYLFERVRLFSRADIDAFSAEFRKHYPDRPRLYTINVPKELLSE